MNYEKSTKFSWRWVFVSIVVFLGVELLIGGFIPGLVTGRYMGRIFWYKLEMVIMLSSYFLGGLLIGLFSPSVRIFEPAIAAAMVVVGTLMYSFFMPLTRCFGFSSDRALIGGAIVFALALFGADQGERIAARLGNQASKDYISRS